MVATESSAIPLWYSVIAPSGVLRASDTMTTSPARAATSMVHRMPWVTVRARAGHQNASAAPRSNPPARVSVPS